MDILLFIIISIALFYYFAIVKNGNLSFWKKASKNPDFVYTQLLADDAWIIADGKTKIDKQRYDGPFLLYVPIIGATVKFYGEIGKLEESQKRIEDKLT
jgi:hypothetical protein